MSQPHIVIFCIAIWYIVYLISLLLIWNAILKPNNLFIIIIASFSFIKAEAPTIRTARIYYSMRHTAARFVYDSNFLRVRMCVTHQKQYHTLVRVNWTWANKRGRTNTGEQVCDASGKAKHTGNLGKQTQNTDCARSAKEVIDSNRHYVILIDYTLRQRKQGKEEI